MSSFQSTAVIDLIIGIWAIVEVHILFDTLYENELLNFFPPGESRGPFLKDSLALRIR